MARVLQFLGVLLLAVLLFACKLPAETIPGSTSPDPERQRLVSDLLNKIPPGASISIQPNLMIYLGPKGSPYLFPVVGDAEYVLTDVTASSDPAVMKGIHDKLREMVDTGQFSVVDAKEGVALLRRGLTGQSRMPEGFYDFLRANSGEEAFPLQARFGDSLELVAYDYQASGQDLVHLTTYWRALRPLVGDYRLVFFIAPLLGLQPEAYEYAGLTSLWYPPSNWQSGEVIKVEIFPSLISRGARTAQVAVYRQSGQQNRSGLPAALPGESNSAGIIRIIDLAEPPTERVSLASFVGVPFEPPPIQTPNPSSPRPSPPKTAPIAASLCGKPLDDPSLARLRPVAVKIDNAPGARPQVGLDQACVVYEHMAEGGITRFTAIYHTEDTEVGPVRSARRVDLHIVPQFQALFAHVGGAPAEMAAIRASKLLDVDQFFNAGAYYYLRQRAAPHNVFTTVSRVRSRGEALGYGREATLEGFPLSESPPEGGIPATEIRLPYPSPSQGEFRYNPQAGDYLRSTDGRPHVDAATGQTIRATTLIVQRVPTSIASYTEDVNGAASLDFDLVGEGPATVFRDGLAYNGKWVRTSQGGWTRFYDETGHVIALKPGKIWISLLSMAEKAVVR